MVVLDSFDRANATQYGALFRSLLFRLANLVARVDGVVTASEIEFLKYYDSMLRYGWTEAQRSETPAPVDLSVQCSRSSANVTPASASYVRNAGPAAQLVPARSLESLLTELNALTGLGQVKAEIARLVSFLQ